MSTLASALTAVPSLEHTQTALGLSVYQQAGLFPLQWRFVTVVVNQQSWGLYLQVLSNSTLDLYISHKLARNGSEPKP